MIRNFLTLGLCLLLLSSLLLAEETMTAPQTESPQLREIVRRYRDILHRIEQLNSPVVQGWVADLDDSGQWADLDYADTKPGNWEPLEHLNRLRDISLALSLGRSGILAESDLESAALRALDHWLAGRYQAPNWWHNQIGVPRAMRDAAILLEGRLDPERRAGALEVVSQYGKVRATGANLLWLGELALHHGCLTGDEAGVADAARRIRGEIAVGKREGIQEDWSFFQHGERLQMFHYGRSYMEVALPLGWQLRGTPWEYSKAEVSILSNLLLEGAQWMMRGDMTVPSTLDRAAARPGRLRPGMRPCVEIWSEVDQARRQELEEFVGQLTGTRGPLEGFRHFEQADFTVYHRPQFSFFVKTVSNRTHLTESINRENLLGKNLNSGDHYLVRTGEEYFDLMPVWDWDRLPGIGSAGGFDRIERRPFTGGVGDGSSGLSVMDLERTGPESEGALMLRRSWFFRGDTVVTLAGGWDLSGDAGDPYLVLDQSRLQGEVSHLRPSGEWRRLEAGEHELGSPLALLHGDVAWFPLNAPTVSVRLGPARGSWNRINQNHGDTPVSEPVFLASIDYRGKPEAGGFAVAPGIGADQARRLASHPTWKVRRNDRSVQAVEFDGDVGMAAFFEAGSVSFGGQELMASAPCLVFRNGEKLLASDPTMRGGPVEIQWNGATRTVQLPANGKAVSIRDL